MVGKINRKGSYQELIQSNPASRPQNQKRKEILSQNDPKRSQKTRTVKVVIITNLEQKQKSALNAENTTDLPKTLQVLSLRCFS